MCFSQGLDISHRRILCDLHSLVCRNFDQKRFNITVRCSLFHSLFLWVAQRKSYVLMSIFIIFQSLRRSAANFANNYDNVAILCGAHVCFCCCFFLRTPIFQKRIGMWYAALLHVLHLMATAVQMKI